MTYQKNDKVQVETRHGKLTGKIQDRYIQDIELELNGQTLEAHATAENPVYLVEFEEGKSDLISQKSIVSE